MKEVLAKSFLKDPDQYLARLKAKERAKQLANLRPQLPEEKAGFKQPGNRENLAQRPEILGQRPEILGQRPENPVQRPEMNPYDTLNANPRPVQVPYSQTF